MNSKQLISSSSLIHFLFYVVIFLTSTTISTSYADGNDTDHHSLLEIKSMITSEALTSWNNSLHFCDWIGVTCGKWEKRVTRLKLNSQGLEGSLSPHVGNLGFLRFLSLSNNSLQGTIPQELGRLSSLQFLYLSTNKFSGVIPVNISKCSNLETLSLSLNDLVGSIPKEIGSSPN
ncbi:putative non-specific serine/threonine protein kinase [Helianthus anomalus]